MSTPAQPATQSPAHDPDGPCLSCGSHLARTWNTREGKARLCPTCATVHGLGCP